MINLLPLAEKKEIVAEYRIRRIVVVARFAIAFFCLVGVLLGLLVAVLLRGNSELAENVRQIKERIATGEAAGVEQSIQHLNSRLRSVSQATSTPSVPPALLLSHIDGLTTMGIQLTSISYTQGSAVGGTAEVILTGVSTDRETLLSFVKALSLDPLFVSVDSPISNLVRPLKLVFNVRAQVRMPKK